MRQQTLDSPQNRQRTILSVLRMILSIILALVLLLILSLFAGGALYLASAAAPHPQTVIPPILSITKSVNSQSVMPGESLMYTLTVANTSTASGTVGLIVTDTVPANTGFENAGYLVGSGSIAMPNLGGTGVVTWTPSAQLVPSDTLQLLLKVKVAMSVPAGTIITNADYGAWEAQFGSVAGQPVTASVTVAPSVPTSLTLMVVPASVPVATTASLTATVYDQFNQPMAGQVVNFSTANDLGWGGAIAPPSATTGPSGQASATILSTLPGVKNVTAAVGGLTASASVTFTVDAGEPYTIALTASPASLLITETARVVATVTDQGGHPLGGRVITFSSPSSFGTVIFSAISPLTGTTDSNGQVTTTVSSLIPGDKLIVATAPNGVTGQTHVNFRGTYYVYLPLIMKHYRAAPSCAPEAWYTIRSELNPVSLAYDAANKRLFVANRDGPNGGSLAVIEPVSGQYIAQVTGLPGAHGVAYDAARNRIFVAGGSTLYIVNGATYTVTSLSLGANVDAYSMAYNPANNKIYVASFRNNSITIVNAATFAITTLVDTRDLPINEPAYIAVNPNNNKVYVANHAAGRPVGFVTVIDGSADAILINIYLSGDLYGITMDAPHNIVYVTSISAARVYAIHGATDQPLGDFQVVRTTDYMPVPLRMIAVNPNATVDTIHLWLTTSSGDWLNTNRGLNRLILISGRWTTSGPEMSQPHVAIVDNYPEDGMLFDPGSRFVFAASAASNLVTVSQDNVTLCPMLLATSANVEPLITVVHSYGARSLDR